MKMIDVKTMQGILGIGRDKAYNLMHSKGFPSIKLGGRYYVEEAALNEWLCRYRFKEYKF